MTLRMARIQTKTLFLVMSVVLGAACSDAGQPAPTADTASTDTSTNLDTEPPIADTGTVDTAEDTADTAVALPDIPDVPDPVVVTGLETTPSGGMCSSPGSGVDGAWLVMGLLLPSWPLRRRLLGLLGNRRRWL